MKKVSTSKNRSKPPQLMIQLKRVYEPAQKLDGLRFLVERLWPRGIKKENLKIDAWLKEAAPSTELRKWFNHDPEKWTEFQRRYQAELTQHPQAWQPILDAAREQTVTLLFSSHDAEHNNVIALKAFLEHKSTSAVSQNQTAAGHSPQVHA